MQEKSQANFESFANSHPEPLKWINTGWTMPDKPSYFEMKNASQHRYLLQALEAKLLGTTHVELTWITYNQYISEANNLLTIDWTTGENMAARPCGLLAKGFQVQDWMY